MLSERHGGSVGIDSATNSLHVLSAHLPVHCGLRVDRLQIQVGWALRFNVLPVLLSLNYLLELPAAAAIDERDRGFCFFAALHRIGLLACYRCNEILILLQVVKVELDWHWKTDVILSRLRFRLCKAWFTNDTSEVGSLGEHELLACLVIMQADHAVLGLAVILLALLRQRLIRI